MFSRVLNAIALLALTIQAIQLEAEFNNNNFGENPIYVVCEADGSYDEENGKFTDGMVCLDQTDERYKQIADDLN